jgi:predicted RNase H-like HicB family nuclease
MARKVPPKKDKRMGTTPPAKVNEQFTVEFDREEDGRWIAEVPELPGVMVYGDTQPDALARVKALAFRVLADREEEKFAPKVMYA